MDSAEYAYGPVREVKCSLNVSMGRLKSIPSFSFVAVTLTSFTIGVVLAGPATIRPFQNSTSKTRALVAGLVRNGVTGAPIAGARVRVARASERYFTPVRRGGLPSLPPNPEVITDEDGRFVVRNLDLLTQPLDISRAVAHEVNIVLGANGGRIDGLVRNASSPPPPRVHAVLVSITLKR